MNMASSKLDDSKMRNNNKSRKEEKVEETFYPFYGDHLPEIFVKKAERELFETPEKRQKSIEDVKKLIRKDQILREEWFSDENITMYLRCRKFDVKKAYSSMKKLYEFIKKHPEYFEPIDQKILDEVINKGFFELFPRRTKDGGVFGLVRFGRWEPSEISIVEYIHCSILILLHMLEDPMTQINGGGSIVDFKCSALKYIRFVTPFYAFFLLQLYLECIPIRIKGVHIINPCFLTKIVLTMIRTFGTEKIKSRVMAHDDPKEVLLYVQSNVIPEEYGGTLPREDHAKNIMKKILSLPYFVTAILEHVKSLR